MFCQSFCRRLTFRFAAILIGSAAFPVLLGPALASNRVALVIGNGAYQNEPALPNPTRDARDVGAALSRLGFKVTQLNNLAANDMRKAIVEFGRSSEGADISVVFYAGHGMEVGGENWLIPIDAELKSDTDIENESVSLKSLNLQVGKAKQLGLIILDACRNNPFAAKMKRTMRARTVTRGLAPTEPTDNVLIAYAARDGTTASDGDGKNSPFTQALLSHIETPGLEVSFLFRHVRDDVMKATKREQQPFVYGSLSKEAIYLKPALKEDVGTPSEEKDSIVSFSSEDMTRIERRAEELKFKLPKFAFGTIKGDVSAEQKRFIGIWASKVGYDGIGRQVMLIITDVLADGTALGNYVFGPPTKASWQQTPAGYTYFAAKISGSSLQYKTTEHSVNATLDTSNLITLKISRPASPGKKAMTPSVSLLPLWQHSPFKSVSTASKKSK